VRTFDVAVVGSPFLDLTFVDLPRLPVAGEEVVARELQIGVGGTALQAVAAARLGLSTAIVAPAGVDRSGAMLRSILEGRGVEWIGRETDATSTTAILSSDEGVAMATALGDGEPSAEEVASAGAGAVVLSLGRLPLRPPGAAVYATTGTIELDAGVRPDPDSLDGARAMILNEREALRVTGAGDAEGAARRLADGPSCVVVTLGVGGALAVESGTLVRVPASVPVGDATGAGDLFVGAYVWADVSGMDVESRLSWASLYAGFTLSANAPAYRGAPHLEAFLELGERRGLRRP
jgi:ribokinase